MKYLGLVLANLRRNKLRSAAWLFTPPRIAQRLCQSTQTAELAPQSLNVLLDMAKVLMVKN